MSDPLANLTTQAVDDFEAILDLSLGWGAVRAGKTRRDLLRRIGAINSRASSGHRRAYLAFNQPALCVTVHPYVIIYNPENRIVLRIVAAARRWPSRLLQPRGG